MSIELGKLYKDEAGENVFWCDNFSGPLTLRLIESPDTLKGVFYDSLNPINNPSSQPQGVDVLPGTFLAKDNDTDKVYLIDHHSGSWIKRYVTTMDVFRARSFSQDEIQTVKHQLLEGMANGPPISRP